MRYRKNVGHLYTLEFFYMPSRLKIIGTSSSISLILFLQKYIAVEIHIRYILWQYGLQVKSYFKPDYF